MARKKVTKKKIKKKSASTVSKKSTRRSPTPKTKKKTSKKKTTGKAPAEKVTKKKVPTKKTATKVAKKPTATGLMKTKKTKSTAAPKRSGKKTSAKSKRPPKRPSPDANGYVIINGRRVRMMSVAVAVVTTPAKRVRRAESSPEPKTKPRKPLKTKLNKKDLDRYRSLLLVKRAELVGDLNAMEAQALKSNGGQVSHMPIHMADVGTDTFDQEFILGMAENERQRLREIDAALKRIEDKTYGVCQMTEKVIPKSRLNAKPWARYTIEAALQIERGLGE